MADEDLMALLQAQGQPNLSFGRGLNPFAQLLIGAAQGLAMPARGGYGRLGPALGQGLATGLGAYEQALEAQRKHAEDLAQLQIEIAKSQQAGRIAQQKDITTRRGQDINYDVREEANRIAQARLEQAGQLGEERIGIESRRAGAAEKSAAASMKRADIAGQENKLWSTAEWGPAFEKFTNDHAMIKRQVDQLNEMADSMTLGEIKAARKALEDRRKIKMRPTKPEKEAGYNKFLDSLTPKAQPNAAPAPKAKDAKTYDTEEDLANDPNLTVAEKIQKRKELFGP